MFNMFFLFDLCFNVILVNSMWSVHYNISTYTRRYNMLSKYEVNLDFGVNVDMFVFCYSLVSVSKNKYLENDIFKLCFD